MSELFERIGLAFKCFFLVLFAGRLPEPLPVKYRHTAEQPRAAGETPREATRAVAGPTSPPPPRAPQPDRAVQLLALLQRDGRLVDFLCEDIASYPDDQVGAAVREVHASCRDTLLKYVGLEPVIAGEEGRPTVIEPGYEPAAVKLVGTITGKPPFRGVLRHRGWRAGHVELPPATDLAAAAIIAPAEVEVG